MCGSLNPVRLATHRLRPIGGGIFNATHKGQIMHERNLMVREGHRDYCLKGKSHKGNPTTPFVLLKGTWLEESGFVIGLPICVRVSQNKLIITP